MQLPIVPKKLSPLRIRALVIGTAFTIATIIVANVIVLRQLHQDTIRDWQNSLLRQSLTLSELTERTFQSADLVLASVADKVSHLASGNSGLAQAALQEFHIFLKDKMLGLTQIDALGIIDADGKTINNSREWPNPNYDLSEREYFRTLKASPKTASFFGEPIRNKANGAWVITLARPVLTAEGKFLGVVFASTALTYFDEVFHTTSLGDGYATTLMRTDGTLLARYPAAGQIGRVAPASILQALGSLRFGVSRSISPIDQQPRIAAAYKLVNYPLVVIATQNETFAFAAWRRTAYQMVLVATLLILTVVISALLIGRSWRQQDRLNIASAKIIDADKTRALAEAEVVRHRESAVQNARFDAAIDNMAQGLCMFDAMQRLIVCNKRYAEIYRLTADHTRPGTELRKILEYRVATGAAPVDHESYIIDRIAEVTANTPYRTVNRLNDGRYVSVQHRPMQGGGWVAMHEDITEQRKAEQELDETKKFLDSIIANIPIAVVVKDAEARKFVLTNRAFEAMVGVSRAELVGKTAFDIYRPGDAERMDKLDREAIERGTGVNLDDFEVETPLNGARVFSTKRIVVHDSQNVTKYVIVVIDDITERRDSEQRIIFMAHNDALTGLANRVTVAKRIEEAAARQRRFGDPFSVLMLDLDRFKNVNDTLGHPAGDALLREVATRLNGFLRETDVLARLGGDEFAIIQAGETNQREAANTLARRVLELFAKPFLIEGSEVNIGTSIGIALAPEHATDADNLLKMADMALYRAKSAGRNGFRFFDPEMSEAASTRRDLEVELRHAIQNEELVLHYQPIIDTKTRKICGAEALIRWQHPTKGLIAPDRFIPLAEETGLISQIGEWVLHNACAEAANWPAGIKVSVNLSPVQFRKSNLPDVVMYALAQSGLPPERLELEITETALIESAAECLPALRQFTRLGISVALDDFGTGYSSLGQLTMFHFDKIKIDKSFIQNMTKRAECAAIISATLTLAHSLDIETTAEGVETTDQYRLLKISGVSSLQGYLFSLPGPASTLEFEKIYGDLEMVDAA